MSTVADRISEVHSRMAEAAQRAGRHADEITLVAVSKGRSVASILEAYAEGIRDFGENRGPDLAAKVPLLPSDIRWHFIGTLQRRKVKLVRPVVVLLHSLDRPSLTRAWAQPDLPAPPVLIQVNVSGELQKHGLPPDDVAVELAAAVEAGLDVRGLMTMAPLADDAESSRPHFAGLRGLRDDLATDATPLHHLSMGMTDDFEIGIEEGATLIRVGRAIFGPVES